MHDAPTTRASLLLRLWDPGDDRSWAEFADLYVSVSIATPAYSGRSSGSHLLMRMPACR